MDCNIRITALVNRISGEKPTTEHGRSIQDRALRMLKRAAAGKSEEATATLPCAGKGMLADALIDRSVDIERFAVNRNLVITDKALRDRLLGDDLLEHGTARDVERRSEQVREEAAIIEGAVDLIWYEAAAVVLLGA